jgi:Fe-S cluster assembly protein SufD
MDNSFKDFKSRIKYNYDNLLTRLNGANQPPISEKRDDSFKLFESQGLPTLKSEQWKYTNLTFLNKIDFKIAEKSEKLRISETDIKALEIENLDTYIVVLYNGYFIPELSDLQNNDLFAAMPLVQAVKSNINELRDKIGKYIDYTNNTFVAINNAMWEDGVYINVNKNKIVDKPIHIISITDSRENAVLTNPRKFIVLEEGSECTIFQSYHTIGDNQGISNSASEIIINNNAKLNNIKLQDDTDSAYSFDFNQVVQKRDSFFADFTICLNGKFIRNNLHTLLDDENAETHFYGVFVGDKQNYVDNHTLVDHAKPNCQSNENYKGILFDKATGVFNGKIMVRKDAQKTNAYQSNKNVLCSKDATINTKPELEIYADDVKCSHGATSGTLEEASLFYLRSRGIDAKMAEAMLLNAHAAEVIEEIKNDVLKEELVRRITNKVNQVL